MMTIITNWEIFSLVHQPCASGVGVDVGVAMVTVGDGLIEVAVPPINNTGSLPGVIVAGALVGVRVRRGVGVRTLSETTTVYLQKLG